MADRHLDLRVDKGNPDDFELAALTLVLSALAGRATSDTERAQPRRARARRAVRPYLAATSWRR